MGISNQQWPWFALLSEQQREDSELVLLKMQVTSAICPPANTCDAGPIGKEIEVPLFPDISSASSAQRFAGADDTGSHTDRGVGKTPIPVEEEEIAAISAWEKAVFRQCLCRTWNRPRGSD